MRRRLVVSNVECGIWVVGGRSLRAYIWVVSVNNGACEVCRYVLIVAFTLDLAVVFEYCALGKG